MSESKGGKEDVTYIYILSILQTFFKHRQNGICLQVHDKIRTL